jgi:hypothetical protein
MAVADIWADIWAAMAVDSLDTPAAVVSAECDPVGCVPDKCIQDFRGRVRLDRAALGASRPALVFQDHVSRAHAFQAEAFGAGVDLLSAIELSGIEAFAGASDVEDSAIPGDMDTTIRTGGRIRRMTIPRTTKIMSATVPPRTR